MDLRRETDIEQLRRVALAQQVQIMIGSDGCSALPNFSRAFFGVFGGGTRPSRVFLTFAA